DFLALLREEAGPAHDELITDLFERITLYDLRATQARAVRQADGRYAVSFEVEAKKMHADGVGHETEAALDEAFDVGAFSEEPGRRGFGAGSVLAFERRPIQSGRQTITLTLDH